MRQSPRDTRAQPSPARAKLCQGISERLWRIRGSSQLLARFLQLRNALPRAGRLCPVSVNAVKANPHRWLCVCVPAEAEQPDGCYTQVAEEVGQIVQGRESRGSRAGERGEPPQPPSTEGVGECWPWKQTGIQPCFSPEPGAFLTPRAWRKTLQEIFSIRV